MHKILILDDERDLVESMAISIEKLGYSPVKTTNYHEAIGAMETLNPDLLLLDLNLGDEKSGFDVLQFIEKEQINMPVIVISAFPNKENLLNVIKHGCVDFIEKPFTKEYLHASIEKAISKNKNEIQNKIEKFNLTDREKEIVALVSKGMKNKEVADSLQIVEQTVKAHLQNIFKKCNFKSRAELMSYLLGQR